ncbi:MAG: WD40 repeat domain-containing protein, partial [Thermoanaerobaculia bacterium]
QQSTRAESERQRAEAERVKAETNAAEARAKKAEAEFARADAVKDRSVAVSAKQKAEESEHETRRLSHLAAARALALSILQLKDPQTSGLLALEVDRLNRENGGVPDDPTVFDALRTARERLRPDATVRQQTNIRAMAIDPDGRDVLAAGDDGRILRVGLGNGHAAVIGNASSAVRTLAVGGGHLATGGDGGVIEIRDLRNPSAAPVRLTSGTAAVSSLAFAPAGATLASANLDGSVKLWNSDGSGSSVTLPGSDGKRATAVTFSPDGKLVAVGRSQGGALFWHVARPAEAPQTICAGVDVRSIAFRPDGKLVACGSGRGEIVQATLSSNTPAPPAMLGHTSSVNSLSFSRDGSYLASASSDSTVRLWNTNAGGSQSVILPGHQLWVWSVGFTPDGDHIVSGGEDRTIRVWPAHVSLLANDLCAAVSPEKKELTEKEWTKYMPGVEYRPGSPCR